MSELLRPYETRVTELTVAPKGEPIYSELATRVKIRDDAAGPFVEVTQEGGSVDLRGVSVDKREWPVIRDAIDKMIEECNRMEGDA